MDTHALDHLRLEVDRDRGLATIVFDDPPKLNRISMRARRQIREIFEELGEDDDIRLIALRGAGERAFTAGGDIGSFLEHSQDELSRLAENVGAPERCPKPVVSLVDGYCLGVGLELALAGDIILATRRSTFGLPEIRLGMIPGSGGTQRLLRIVGPIRAKWLLFRGAHISAEEAYALGLVSKLVETREELDQALEALLGEIRALSPLTLRHLKAVLNEGMNLPLEGAIALEGRTYGLLRTTADFEEGVRAFLEKRTPRFSGR